MIIDFNRYNGGGGSGSGVTPAQVQQQINSALTPYWDSAATESAITQSVSGKADAANVSGNTSDRYFPAWNEQGIITGKADDIPVRTGHLGINGRGFTIYSRNSDLGNIYGPQSAGTAGDILVSTGRGAPVWSAVTFPDVSNYVTSAQVETQIVAKNYVTSAQVETQIDTKAAAYTPTSGFSTINGSAITNGGDLVIQGGGGDMSNYWNSAETKTYVDSAATNLQDQIDTLDEVVSAALVDLNEKKVESEDIKHIVKLTQAEYDQLATKDPETFYIIINNNN